MLKPAPLAALGLMLCGSAAHAQEWTINLERQKMEQLGLDPDAIESDIESTFGDYLKLDEQQAYLNHMAAASAMAVKGMGADYATNPQRFVLGGSVGTALSGDGFGFTPGDGPLPSGGFAFQASVLAGLNLGAFSKDESFLRRVMIYGSGLTAKTKTGAFEARTWHVAGHGQLKLIRPKKHEGLVEWGGLDLTSGVELTNTTLHLAQGLPLNLDQDIRWDPVGSYDITTDAYSIPVELSTNLRVVVATVYLGAALDITQSATADSDIELGGAVRYEGDPPSDLGSVQLSMKGQGDASGFNGRAFGGLQFNIFFVKLYGQLNVGINETVGGHFGLRIAM